MLSTDMILILSLVGVLMVILLALTIYCLTSKWCKRCSTRGSSVYETIVDSESNQNVNIYIIPHDNESSDYPVLGQNETRSPSASAHLNQNIEPRKYYERNETRSTVATTLWSQSNKSTLLKQNIESSNDHASQNETWSSVASAHSYQSNTTKNQYRPTETRSSFKSLHLNRNVDSRNQHGQTETIPRSSVAPALSNQTAHQWVTVRNKKRSALAPLHSNQNIAARNQWDPSQNSAEWPSLNKNTLHIKPQNIATRTPPVPDYNESHASTLLDHITDPRLLVTTNERPPMFGTESVKVNVIEVPDGDGVTAFDAKAGEILDVRLIGIDAPEMKGGQPFALESKSHLERLVLRKSVILTKYSLDQYERVLGNLRVPGKVENVSLEMLKAGLACVYVGKDAEYGGMFTEFHRAESLAKKQKIGMWALDNVELPMDYKRKQKDFSP